MSEIFTIIIGFLIVFGLIGYFSSGREGRGLLGGIFLGIIELLGQFIGGIFVIGIIGLIILLFKYC